MHNKTYLIGNIATEPVLRSTSKAEGEDGVPVCNFILATHSIRKTANGHKTRTEFHPVATFGPAAVNMARRLRKGDLVFVAGPTHRSVNETEGHTYHNAVVRTEEWQFVARPQSRTASASQPPDQETEAPSQSPAPAASHP